MREPSAARRLLLASGCAALLGLAAPAGCSGAAEFDCSESSQCAAAGEAGTCEPSGYCSFPDGACPSGRRYGEHAPAGVAGTCVPVPDATVGSTLTGGEGSAAEGSGSGLASTGNPAVDDTSGATSNGPDTSEGTTLAPGSTSGSSGAPVSGSSEGSETAGPVTVLSYPAALAECNAAVDLDPDACELGGDPSMGAVVVDLMDTGIGPIHTYLRFDLDDALEPALVTSVTLRLVATNASMSPASGEVHLVEPFTAMDLYALQPATVGPVLARDQGAVAMGDVVEWPLPPDLLPLGDASLHLGILPVSTDGIDYWNLDGAEPPELVVEQLDR